MKAFLLFGLLLALPAIGQEHAPTVAQCQADIAIWGDTNLEIEYRDATAAFLSVGTPNKSKVNNLGLDKVVARMTEMDDCGKVDPQGLVKYSNAAAFYEAAFKDRFVGFVKRHNLLPQLKLEDAQGKR
jgi:hypothetical protein